MSGLLIAGCSVGLPQAQSDPTHFYVLSVAPSVAAAVANANAPVVRLRPIEVASYLRGRPMIVRRGENEVDFREFARWGEPLEQGIARVLREELLARGSASVVDAGGLRSSDAGDAKLQISVRVLACEGVADGRVDFDAMWEVSAIGVGGGTPVRGEYRPTDLKWTVRNDASLAAALSKAVSGLADEIAGGIAKAK